MSDTYVAGPLRLETGDRIARLTDDGADERLDLWRVEHQQALIACIARLEASRSSAAILISKDPVGFLSRPPLTQLTQVSTKEDARRIAQRGQLALKRLSDCTTPIVAVVTAPALGTAFEVALACHGRVASDNKTAVFGLPDIQMGMIPSLNGLQRLAGIVGFGRAIRFGLSGTPISSQLANQVGLAMSAPPTKVEERAAECALSLAERKSALPANWLTRGTVAGTRAGRRLLIRAARRRLRAMNYGDYPAPLRVLEVLSTFSEYGMNASVAAELDAFGELSLSTSFRQLVGLEIAIGTLRASDSATPTGVSMVGIGERAVAVARNMVGSAATLRLDVQPSQAGTLGGDVMVKVDGQSISVRSHFPSRRPNFVEVMRGEASLPIAEKAVSFLKYHGNIAIVVNGDPTISFSERIVLAMLEEASVVAAEGTSWGAIDDAMLRWGFRQAPSKMKTLLRAAMADMLENQVPLLPAPGGDSHPPLQNAIRREEVQMRCVLKFATEALRCLDEGVIGTPQEGDVAAVIAAGFPRFRGGPFRYVDAIGATEIVRRLRAFEDRVGSRWTPPALLLRLDAKRQHLYS